MGIPKTSVVDRLWKRCVRNEETGCLEWQGGCSTPGYGQIMTCEGKNIGTHIAAWIIHKGSTWGLCVLHRCDNRKCVEITHLFLGTKKVNADDAAAKGRSWWQSGKEKKWKRRA